MRLSSAGIALFMIVSSIAAAESPPPHAEAAAPATESATGAGDAAAKHAKRTECLKDAKQKKLMGAEKTAFIKGCIDAR
jgi:psiF repeat